ncbi:hypothetical protein Gpo141_00012713 [Globisporangium polare]
MPTTTQLWRGALELAIVGTLWLQEAGHELLLALYALRTRGARFSLPDTEPSHISNRSSSTTASSSSPTSRRKRRLSAMEFLEKFRRGPENQSEWNLFLWRVTFPMVALVLFTLFAVVGKMGHAFYSLLVCPLWYLCNFVLVVYPFDVVFRFPDIEKFLQSGLWKMLALASFGISAVEWYVSSPKSRFSWIVGNTLFGIVALITIPLFFTRQSRIPREQGSALRDQDQQQQQYSQPSVDREQSHLAEGPASASSSSPVAELLLPTASSTAASSMRLRAATTDFAAADSSSLDPLRSQDPEGDTIDVTKSLLSTSSQPPSHSIHHQQLYSHATINRPPPANKKTSKLIRISAVCIGVVWLAMFTSYNSSRGGAGAAAGVASRYWFLTYLLSPVLCIVLFWTRQQNTNFSFDHVVLYGMLVVHIPVFLGHFCIRLFAMAEDSGNHGSSWLKLGISVLYLLVMQGYFFVITHVVNAMAEPFAHPSLLYIGQLYYYLFWYILVGSDAPIDALYWGMLLVNNVHIAFLNTGIYTDVKRSSSGCVSMPLNLSIGSSVAVCFRASASHHHSRSDNESAGPRNSIGTSQGEEDDDDEEQQYASESDGFLSDQESVLPVYVKSRRTPAVQGATTTTRESSSHQGHTRTTGTSQTSSAVISCPSAVASIRDSCSLDGGAKRSSGRKRRAANIVLPSHRSSMEHLKPLYFLMKLAEQDNMADTTALILVPSLLTLMAVFEKPSEGIAILYDQMNMWIRCICMFIGRLGGAYLAREIFAYKLKSRLRSAGNNAIGTIEGMSTRLWIQRLMLQDFHRQFWYLMVVTIVVTFACFDRVDLPLRFALLT